MIGESTASCVTVSFVFQFGHGYASCFYVIKPERNLTSDGVSLMANMSVSANSGVSLYRSSTEHFTNWVKVNVLYDYGCVSLR